MRHARLVIHRLHLDGVEVPVRFGTLVAVLRDETDQVEWEVVADCVDDYGGELGRFPLEVLCITGANADGQLLLGELSGDVIVARFVDRTVVLRGDGPLVGLTPDLLA